MKRNGFTLVELLAVIAILAILVIIALPNVMGMFNEAKKNSFTTEVKQVYKQAQQAWISDSMFNTKEQVYSRCKTCTGKSLDLTGRSELEYYIKIDKSGNVVEYNITDGTYQYSYKRPNNSTDGLRIENIDNPIAVADIKNEGDIIDINKKVNDKQICLIDMVGAENSQRYFIPFIENVTWEQYYSQADGNAKSTLDYLWGLKGSVYRTNIITSKCFLEDGGNETTCYRNAIHNPGPYSDSDYRNSNFYGFREEYEIILDSTKVCYTYID